ncbi:MAG: phenylacetate--CoA ligase family protein [Rhodospirillaceae bacterium]|nr:phenylacetate--CoA ligase family protein [Rhodospirillaceae bacterium]MBT3928977.1 phenylacetate--CoA ligase family protein [Rhodospirillaceae bacterium]MBT4428123.1 phenylacetate--CoA ligase family protein [Rhodospirillaceae bacterium]MBT5037842.1 phenylacetate--CoA ligase family protein [Rhodospirillaceae bacterium]MBT5676784.1 phenylacetate--CoA ligase family protein [Rhodospirillaceae bacterium]
MANEAETASAAKRTSPLRGGDVISTVEGLAWPAIPDQRRLLALNVLYQMERSERWPAERVRRYQFRQLRLLLRHAAQHVPFYRERFRQSGFDPEARITPESWRQIPLLTRSDIQENFAALQSEALPKAHGKIHEVFSSGSTGAPVRVRKSGLSQIFWLAFTARFHLWNGDDMSQVYGAIKTQKNAAAASYPKGVRARAWGGGFPFATGPSVILNLNSKTHEQAEWLSRTKPAYLLSYPSILEALAKHCLHEGIELPSIKRVHSMSEVLRPEVRRVCRQAWDAPVYDNYSTEETGYIALQCPKSEQLLVQPEGVYAEFLDPAGRDVGAGEIGNMIVTPLHNFAMPLIRYEVGDYAEVGGKSACGRQYQVIERVLGRTRNMVRLPNGQTHYPDYQDILDGFDHVVQFQIVRRAEEELEMKLVVRRELVDDEEEKLTAWLRERFQYPFQISFTYHDEIPRAPSGKFLDYISEVD